MQRPDSRPGSGSLSLSGSGTTSGSGSGEASGAGSDGVGGERWTALEENEYARGVSPVMIHPAEGDLLRETGPAPRLPISNEGERRPLDQQEAKPTRTPSFHVQRPSGDAAALVIDPSSTPPLVEVPSPPPPPGQGRFTTFMQARRPRSRQASDQSVASRTGTGDAGPADRWTDASLARDPGWDTARSLSPPGPLRSASGSSTTSSASRDKSAPETKPASRTKTLRKKTSRLFSSASGRKDKEEIPRAERTVSSSSMSTAASSLRDPAGSPRDAKAVTKGAERPVPLDTGRGPSTASSSASHRQLVDPFVRGSPVGAPQHQHRRRSSAASSSETSFLSVAVADPAGAGGPAAGSAPKVRRGSSGSGTGGGASLPLFRSRSRERERDRDADERALHSVAEDGPTGAPAQRRPGSSAQGGNLPQRMSAWFGHILPTGAQAQAQLQPQPGDSSSFAAHRLSGPPSLTDRDRASFASSPSRQRDPQGVTASPSRKIPGAGAATQFLAAARQKAVGGVRYLLDSEAHPDGCEEPIWVMGVRHGYDGMIEGADAGASGSVADRPGSVVDISLAATRKTSHDSGSTNSDGTGQASTSGVGSRLTQLFGNTGQGAVLGSFSPGRKDRAAQAQAAEGGESPSRPGRMKGKEAKRESVAARQWPQGFYDDFRSILWCTYRSQYAPISALPPHSLLVTPEEYSAAVRRLGRSADSEHVEELPLAISSSVGGSRPSGWAWVARSGEKGLTSDAGWGCMLRTGQSMLANALIHLHLGREWKRAAVPDEGSPHNEITAFTTYTQILTWFLDDPSPACPFSVHRMALIGKQLGKEIGEWFGPSTAAGAIKILTNNFDPSGLAVSVASDGIVFRSDVLQASHSQAQDWQDAPGLLPKRTPPLGSGQWGEKAVLVLVGVRLGLEGVNPLYHDSIKALFTFPQSVGIAGGRPSSSYYFVGTQANSLYYLDPHMTRPAVPLPRGPRETRTDAGDLQRMRRSSTITQQNVGGGFAMLDEEDTTMLDAYDPADIATFHCEKIKRMAISGMDPSMLLGFLCKDESDWLDLVQRLNELKHKIVTIQDQPPSWDSDDFDAGMESLSEADPGEEDGGSFQHGGSQPSPRHPAARAAVVSEDEASAIEATPFAPAVATHLEAGASRRPALEDSLTTLGLASTPHTPTRADPTAPVRHSTAQSAGVHTWSASHSVDSLSKSFDQVGRDEIDMLDTPLPQTGFFEDTGDKVTWEGGNAGPSGHASPDVLSEDAVLVRRRSPDPVVTIPFARHRITR